MMGGDADQLLYAQQIEQQYSRRILEILEPIVGKQNVKAQVTAEVDFSQTESTTESHKPNQTPDSGAIRSQQTVESSNGAATAPPAGVPGATTNQPPAQASAPINGPAQALTSSGQQAGAGPTKRESIVNYEVDKTVRVVKGATGVIKRVNAAVVVNNQTVTDAKGKTTSSPLSADQVEKMTALVREAVGFNKERGDSVNLLNSAFVIEKVTATDVPIWRQPEVLDWARSLAWPVGTLGFAALVLLGVIRPVLNSVSAPRIGSSAPVEERAGQLDAIEAELPERPQLVAPKVVEPVGPTAEEQMLEDARKLTRDNPAAVANIIKTWINGGAPA
jgi:flagellar M-ring protein FliF